MIVFDDLKGTNLTKDGIGNRYFNYPISILFFLLFCPALVSALELTPFPGSSIVVGAEESQDYQLALGPMKNINGNWQPETTLLVSGQAHRTIYELPKNRSLQDVLESYQKQLRVENAQPLFVCNGHNCGSSGSWANLHFNQRSLYGLDQTQHYLVYQANKNNRSHLVVIYLVTRGNKRSYLLVDQIISEQSVNHQLSAQTVETLLDSGQYISLTTTMGGEQWVLDDTVLSMVARVLTLSPAMKLVVVASDHRSDDLDKNIANSKTIANAAVAKLVDKGSSKSRLRAEGIGNLAGAENGEVRVWVFQY